MEVNKFELLKQSYKKMEIVESLWKSIDKWKTDGAEWMTSNWVDVDAEVVNKDTALLFKDSFSLNKKLNNKVTERLKSELQEFKGKTGAILELGNKNLKASPAVREI